MIEPGTRIPDVTFRTRKNGEWVDVTTDELFGGKTVVLFALPGAFTPTCSSTHLPGYMELGDQIKAEGVDSIICLSVNDGFVMNAWAKDQMVDDEVIMLPDGNGDFTRGMGMLVSKTDLGFGDRSWRYSAVIKDGVVEKVFAEDRNAPGDPFEVSDAVTMLNWLKERKASKAA